MVNTLLNRATEWGAKLRQPADSLNRDPVQKASYERIKHYEFWEAVYENRLYQRPDADNPAIRTWPGFPRNIRPISLAAKRAVDWWPGSVYPGTWTKDGLPASNGWPNLIAYDADTPEELRLATQQSFAWGNAVRFLDRIVHLGSMLGDVFCEVEVHYNEDDPSSNKVYPVIVHPAHLVELDLNARGDVKAYRLAIPQYDEENKRPYIWGKRVTKTTITTYYDDDEHSYVDGQPASIPNQWGFVPAVWIPHRYAGGTHGAPVMDVVVLTLAEYDGVLASLYDYVHKFVRQGVVIETKDAKGAQQFLSGQTVAQGAAVNDYSPASARDQIAARDRERQQINAFPVPEGTRVHHLIQNLGLGDADSHVNRLAREIEDALPEMVFSERLMAMDQVTKPGAMALISRVQSKLNNAAGNYDMGVVKLGQMCAAIGGELAKNGQWGLRSRLTKQQQAFLPFDLLSYQKNELDFGLTPRELIPRTKLELAQEAVAIETLQTATGLRHVGFSDEEIYGEDQIPEVKLGILEATGPARAADIGAALVQSFNAGLTQP